MSGKKTTALTLKKYISPKPNTSHDESEKVHSNSPLSEQYVLNSMAKDSEGTSSSQRVEMEKK